MRIILDSDVPELPGPCRIALTAVNCTYDLANGALTSQLITHTPYTFKYPFTGPEGTQSLPVAALEHFASRASKSAFEMRLLSTFYQC